MRIVKEFLEGIKIIREYLEIKCEELEASSRDEVDVKLSPFITITLKKRSKKGRKVA